MAEAVPESLLQYSVLLSHLGQHQDACQLLTGAHVPGREHCRGPLSAAPLVPCTVVPVSVQEL